MIWLSASTNSKITPILSADPNIGVILHPRKNRLKNEVSYFKQFACDNGCYGKDANRVFDFGYYTEYLLQAKTYKSKLLFATAPDVVGDAAATWKRSSPYLQKIRDLDIPAALCFQDGIENLHIDWDTFDVMFIGGTTDFKLSPEVKYLCTIALEHSKWIHMGRVNSLKRMLIAKDFGCHSTDGSKLSFGPQVNLEMVLNWMRKINN
jgi:hypothetical protein